MRAQRGETRTPEGDALGFIGELFSGWLELSAGNRIYLHYIISRVRSEATHRPCGWLDHGYDVMIVMPRPIMQHILEKFGFVPSSEYLPDQYDDRAEVWYRLAVTERPCLVD
jgi:hypothetical protein